MRITIRQKLIFAISTFILVLFSLVAWLFINEKRTELADDIYVNSLAFAKLTAPEVVEIYDLYLAQDSFVYFNREISNIFEQNDDVDRIQLVSYAGDLLYDSDLDTEKANESDRIVEQEDLMLQVKSERISVKLADGRLVYLHNDEFFDEKDRAAEAIESGSLVDRFVVPATEKYSVVYSVDYHNLTERVETMMRRISYLAAFGVLIGLLLALGMSAQLTRPIRKLVVAVGEIAKGNFKTRVEVKTRDELNFLGRAVNKMAGELEESMEAKLYKERVAHELELATKIQDQIIPDTIPETPGLKIAAGLIPAGEIGGDMYDFLQTSDDKLLMYLGDVTGHGVPAGIVSSVASALFYGYSLEPDLQKIMIDVNRVLKAKTMPNMFMTLCLMQWDSTAQKFTFVNAGHEQIIKYKAQERVAELQPAGGIALGMLEKIDHLLTVQEVPMEVGDFIVIYSDGIPEAFNEEREQYGMQRLQKRIATLGELESAAAIKEAILADVKQFMDGAEQADDITLIVIKRV